MRKYNIVTVDGIIDWDKIEKAYVDIYPWGGAYRPNVFARVVCDSYGNITIRMECNEIEPLALCTVDNQLVCNDSCMECFLCFEKTDGDLKYLGLEANAKGVLYSSYGTKSSRMLLSNMQLPTPKVTAFVNKKGWGIEITVNNDIIKSLTGRTIKDLGGKIYGNFYKCGDKTEFPHFGVWNNIEFPYPNFGLPEQFGELIINTEEKS